MVKIHGKRLIRNKKGSAMDLLIIGVVLLFFGVVALIGFRVTSGINDQIQSMDVFPTNAKTASTTLTGHYSGVIDNSFLLLTIGLAIGAFVLAALVRVHPIFIPLFFLALILIIFFSGIFSNIYQEMETDSGIIETDSAEDRS